jgi:hypothetical protein
MWIRGLLLVAMVWAGCGGKQPASAPPPPGNPAGPEAPPAAPPGSGAAPALCDDLECLESGGTGTCLALCKGTLEQCEQECSPEARCPKVPCPD